MEEVYSLSQIKDLWEDYQAAKGWRVLRDGKWKLHRKAPDTTDGATSAEMVKVKDYLTFPTYLEKFR